MVLPSLRRILSSDFEPSEQTLVTQLAFPINSAFDTIYLALNNNLTFGDNMLCTVTNVTVTVNASGSINTPPIITLNSTQKGMNVTGLIVLNATNVNGVLPTGGIFVSFSNSTNSTNGTSNITINNVKGLPAGVPFTLRLAAFT